MPCVSAGKKTLFIVCFIEDCKRKASGKRPLAFLVIGFQSDSAAYFSIRLRQLPNL